MSKDSSLSDTISFKLRPWLESLDVYFNTTSGLREHLDATIGWLCHAQDVTIDHGVAQTYLVRRRHWANSYPETTGYIIPTFYSYFGISGNPDIRHRAKKMVEWECEIQLPSGGVLAGALGDSDQPTIFNTGQVLFGWVRAFEEEGNEDFRLCAVKAADWLCAVQDEDGCWRQFGSPMTGKQINTYNTRSAWGLCRVYSITGDQRYLDAAIRNVEWALSMQMENGWLRENCLQDNDKPLVHTIAYAMRGIMEIGVISNREDFIISARKIGDALLTKLPSRNLLPGRFNSDWSPTVSWSCLTGCAQIGINWGRLYQITGEDAYRQATRTINTALKKTQKLSGDLAEKGGVKGSHPISGGYHPWQYPNWPAKFFADSLMIEAAIFTEDRSVVVWKNDG